VVLLEKGGYYEGEDMNQRDEDMIPLLWKNSGANFTYDLRVTIAQGSCLGGSTVINDAVCFPIPQVTSRQWRDAGVEISDAEWDAACEEVSNEIHVTKVRDDELDRNSLLLKKGCTEAGYTHHFPNSRNCVNCMQCGLCHLGCHYETKQDMKVTYIHKALNDPNSEIRIYCNCDVWKLGSSSSGVIDFVEGNFVDGAGTMWFKITVNAAIVVIAAGSIASSYLLLRNLIAPDRAGKGLALHPAPFLLGDFPYLVRGHQGIPMAYTLHDFGVTNGVEKGGFLVEGIFVPPLQFSILISVAGDLQDELMTRYENYGMAGVLIRDSSNGTITVADQGLPKVTYVLGQPEATDIAKGIETIGKMWFKLGATRLVSSHLDKVIINNEDDLNALVNLIRTNPSGLMLGSAHPQGGNRMGSDPKTCVVDSNGVVFGFKNLFVCDASVFPTAVGVNPQLTVMSLATIVSERINRNWNKYAVTPIPDQLGEVCSIRQPMYCSTGALEDLYKSRDNAFSVSDLVNSEEDQIIDGKNWSFDPETLTIRNDRYWKGFLGKDGTFVSTVEMYAGGFWKKFSKAGDSIAGVTHPYDFNVYAKNVASEAVYPGFGKVIRLKYTDLLYQTFYDFLKIVDNDTILGEAFVGLDPPKGAHLLSFSMSRKYKIDFMTQDDFQAIFATKSRRPDPEEVLGLWEGRLISDSALSPVAFRFRYSKDSQGQLTCNYVFGNFLPGTSIVKLGEKELKMFDFTGGLLHDDIRMLRKDVMLGKYESVAVSILNMLEKRMGFVMRQNDKVSLPYLLNRIA
jgi:choline dehydrogenase-like flavoprotein